MSSRVNRAWRPFAAATASAAVALTGVALGGAPTVSAASAATCDVAFPVADLVAHQPVTGLTVSEGTEPDVFTGEVLGVLNNGIAPGLDMVMVRLTSTEIDRIGGIWAGMSGSPVYAEDGRLIGAVAYGLAVGPSPVAGVTPFEDMDDYLTPPVTPRVPVGPKAAARIASGGDVTAAQAAQGFRRLPLAGGVSGLASRQLDRLTGRPRHQFTGMDLGAASLGTSAAATAADIVPGGNLGFGATGGDIAMGGVGTVTSVCGDEVVGFGHPASYLGEVTAALQPADTIYVQEDPTTAPFKVANLGDPVGTITDDHGTGITGVLNSLPDSFTVSSTATSGARSRTGDTQVYMQEYGATATLYQLYYNQDRVLDAMKGGTEQATWTIEGTGPGGAPFAFTVADRYVSSEDIAFEGVWDTPDFVWQLSQIEGVSLGSVSSTATFTASKATWKVRGLSVRKGGAWVPVEKGDAIPATAGSNLKIQANLKSTDGATRNVVVSVAVPKKSRGQARLVVLGGSQWGSDLYGADTLNEVLDVADSWVGNDQVVALFDAPVKGQAEPTPDLSGHQSLVVTGRTQVRVNVSK